MIDRELDRLIDRAAEQLIGHEPSRALTDAVMSRVGVTRRRYPLWVAPAIAAAAVLLVVVLAFVPRASRTDSASVVLPALQPVAAPREFAARPIAIPSISRAVATVQVRAESRVTRPMPAAVGVSAAAAVDTNSVAAVEPIGIQKLTPEPIDVEPLAIEPLVIEPLASND